MPTSWRSRLLIGLAVLAAVVGLFFAVRALSSGSDADVASQTPEPSESASPSEEPVAQPKPFRVEILSVKGEAIDSTNMFGRKPGRPPAAVKRAAEKAGETLQRYLNAAFVEPRSRFTQGPIALLLTDHARLALDDRDRRALGADGPMIAGGTTISANARASVLYEGNRPHAVKLRYAARMSIIYVDRPARMTQTGTLVFRRLRNGSWRADLADVQLSLPEAPPEKPSEEPSEATGEEPTEGVTP